MNWTFPYCNIIQTVTEARSDDNFSTFNVGNDHFREMLISSWAIDCANEDCSKITVMVMLSNFTTNGIPGPGQKIYLHEQILPSSRAKPQPEFIPQALREDYEEACKIRNLSPKASATLARRCLQGMIRDFADVREGGGFQHEAQRFKQT